MPSLIKEAVAVLSVSAPIEKAMKARQTARDWQAGKLEWPGKLPDGALLPDRPGRPERPLLRPAREVPKRKIGTAPEGRIALLHALAHIELNAIDLAFDILARFTDQDLPRSFFDDWIAVGDDEARHFLMIEDRLKALGSGYGALPAHDGLWEASMATAHDLKARLAVVPLVLEARGLDVTPAMIERLRAVGDDESADALQVIHDDEITHVAAGKRWFGFLCRREALPERETWQHLVRTHFRGILKRPFNTSSRSRAGFPAAFYEPLAEPVNAPCVTDTLPSGK